jgi:hypothetical protein
LLGYQHEELLQGNWEHFSFPEDWKLSLEQLKVQDVLPPALAQNIVSGSKITVETGEIKIV